MSPWERNALLRIPFAQQRSNVRSQVHVFDPVMAVDPGQIGAQSKASSITEIDGLIKSLTNDVLPEVRDTNVMSSMY